MAQFGIAIAPGLPMPVSPRSAIMPVPAGETWRPVPPRSEIWVDRRYDGDHRRPVVVAINGRRRCRIDVVLLGGRIVLRLSLSLRHRNIGGRRRADSYARQRGCADGHSNDPLREVSHGLPLLEMSPREPARVD